MKQLLLGSSPHRAQIWRDEQSGQGNVFFWGVTFATVGLGLIIGFFLHGGTHGLYMDDYSEKAWAYNFADASWKLNLSPQFHIRSFAHIVIANLSNAIPRYEFAVRALIVGIHLLNVLLIGNLAYRLTGSRFIGAISSAYFLFPIFANEALLWFAASIANTISLALLLIGFHCLLSCHSVKEKRVLFCCGVGAWIVMILFYEPGLFTLLLLPVFISMAHSDYIRPDHKVWILALVGAYVPIGAYLFFVERAAPEVASRGGATLNVKFILSNRVPDAVHQLTGLLTYWGISGPLPESFALGRHEWLSLNLGRAAVIAFLVAVVLAAMTFPLRQDTIPDTQRLITLLFISVAWILLSMIPVVLLRTQGFAIRILYTPSAGFSLGVAALAGLLANLFGRWPELIARTILLTTGAILLLCGLTMAGLLRTYQLRSDLDGRQLDALGQVIPSLPRSEPLWLLPVALDETTVGRSWGPTGRLDEFLFGVFEIPWSAQDAVRLRYGERTIQAVTSNRWETPHITSFQRPDNDDDIVIRMQNQSVPVRQLLAFTYRQGRLVLLSPLQIYSSDGHQSVRVDLPLVTELAQKGIEAQPCRFQLEPAK